MTNAPHIETGSKRRIEDTDQYMVVGAIQEASYPEQVSNAVDRHDVMQDLDGIDAAGKTLLARDSLESFYEQDPNIQLYRMVRSNIEQYKKRKKFIMTAGITEPSLKFLNDDIADMAIADEIVDYINLVSEKHLKGLWDYERASFTSKGSVSVVDLTDLLTGKVDLSDSDIEDIIYDVLKEKVEECKEECRRGIIEIVLRVQREYVVRRSIIESRIAAGEDAESSAKDAATAQSLSKRIANIGKYVAKLKSGQGIELCVGIAPMNVAKGDADSLDVFDSVVKSNMMSTIASRAAKKRVLAEQEEGDEQKRVGVQVATSYKYLLMDLIRIRAELMEAIAEDPTNEWTRLFDSEDGALIDDRGDVRMKRGTAAVMRKIKDFRGTQRYRDILAQDPRFEERLTKLEKLISEGIDVFDFITSFRYKNIGEYHERLLRVFGYEEEVEELETKLNNGGMQDDEPDEVLLKIDREQKISLKSEDEDEGRFVTKYGRIAALLEAGEGSFQVMCDRRGMGVDNMLAYWDMCMEMIDKIARVVIEQYHRYYDDPEFLKLGIDPLVRIAFSSSREGRLGIMLLKNRILTDRGVMEYMDRKFGKKYQEQIADLLMHGCDDITDAFKRAVRRYLGSMFDVGEIGGDEIVFAAGQIPTIIQNPEILQTVIKEISEDIGSRVAVQIMDRDPRALSHESGVGLHDLLAEFDKNAESRLKEAKLREQADGETTQSEIPVVLISQVVQARSSQPQPAHR